MKKFKVSGMSCAACSARVDKAVRTVDGVSDCCVNLLTNSMTVEGSASDQAIVTAVKNAGYKAKPVGEASTDSTEEDSDDSVAVLKRALVWSVVFLVLLMYVSMGHVMFGWRVPSFLGSAISIGLYELLGALIIILINNRFYISGFKALKNKAPNMDTLVSLGSGISFLWSIAVLFRMANNPEASSKLLPGLYFESSAMILTLITVGKLLEAVSKGKTTNALKALNALAPNTALILIDNIETEVDISTIKVGDVVVIKPGASVSVDGEITRGSASINEACLTGEALPVDKTVGDSVSAGTLNASGYILVRATRVGKDTLLSQIIQTVADSSASKAPIARTADKVSGVFVPVVLGLATICFVIWMLITKNVGYSLERAISILVISCPCALGLATPVAIMVGNGVGASNGILFKTATALEETGRAKVVVFDKTGTITEGKPKVTDVITNGIPEDEFMRLAVSIESMSDHPLAKAVVESAKFEVRSDTHHMPSERIKQSFPKHPTVCGVGHPMLGTEPYLVSDFENINGVGLKGTINGKAIIASKSEAMDLPNEFKNRIEALSAQGKTPLCFSYDGKFIGAIMVADTLKADSKDSVEELHRIGINTIMLTGDNHNTASYIAKQVGIDKVIAGVLPTEKSTEIAKLKLHNKVIMVGDGINDSPALAKADVGFAISNGSDIAIDSADVVLLNNNLTDVVVAVKLARKTLKNIHENLFWAFIYNLICIPLAAGVLIPLGITLVPMYGAAAMSLSSFCVVTNALRLNLLKLK